ncbi:MAG: transporter [Candidatus Binatota bacterium]
MPALLAIIFFVLASISLRDALRAEEITATPNRPGVADPADVTQKGVVELEYGWERAFRSSEFRTRSIASGLLRFGLTEDFELRLGIDNYVTQRSDDPEGRRSGVGDTTPGFKYRLTKGDGIWPTLAFSYEIKTPTASRKKGLGSGRADHNLFFLASKDLLGLEWDFNYQLGWIGKEGKKSFDDSHLWALSLSRPLFGPVGISGEIYGGPRVNRQTPGFTGTDWALTYAVTPRVILDAGVDIGLTSAARDVTYFAGITIALVDVYRRLGLKE